MRRTVTGIVALVVGGAASIGLIVGGLSALNAYTGVLAVFAATGSIMWASRTPLTPEAPGRPSRRRRQLWDVFIVVAAVASLILTQHEGDGVQLVIGVACGAFIVVVTTRLLLHLPGTRRSTRADP